MGNFFVRRPIVAMVIAIVTVIVGVVFLVGLPTEQYPDITPPMVSVRTSYIGADAVSVEQSVATPIEQQVNGVDNMIYMKSINANDGTMNLQVSFDIGTDPDMNTVFTQNRVGQAEAKLPEEVKRYGVTTQKSFSFPMMLRYHQINCPSKCEPSTAISVSLSCWSSVDVYCEESRFTSAVVATKIPSLSSNLTINIHMPVQLL